MKHSGLILAGLLLGSPVHAAAPASPQAATGEAQPTGQTAPALASDPETGRGNPRRQQVLPGQGDADEVADAGNGSSDMPASPSGPPAPAPVAAPPETPRGSADRIELQATQITGNAELPRVMYVVPWKRPEPGELGGRPAKSLLDEVLAPVDRDVFRRQNSYYEALRPDAAPEQP